MTNFRNTIISTIIMVMAGTTLPAQDTTDTKTDKFVDTPVVRVKPGQIPDNIPELWKKAILPAERTGAIVLVLNQARTDALERLEIKLRKAEIAPGVKIADYISKSDQPGVDLKLFLHGADETGVRLRSDMLVCETEIRTNLRTAIACFKGWADEHVDSSKIDVTLLNRYVETVQNDISSEIGTAAVDMKFVNKSHASKHKAVRIVVLNPPLWISNRIMATGRSALDAGAIDREVEKQRAYREAEERARKQLLRRVYALKFQKDLTVGDFVDKSTETGDAIRQFCENAPEVKAARRIMNKSAEFSVSLNMKTLWNMFVHNRVNQK